MYTPSAFCPRAKVTESFALHPKGIREWCADWFNQNEYNERKIVVKDPKGPQKGIHRVTRGGSFVDSCEEARCSYRSWGDPYGFSDNLGFRVALSSIKLDTEPDSKREPINDQEIVAFYR